MAKTAQLRACDFVFTCFDCRKPNRDGDARNNILFDSKLRYSKTVNDILGCQRDYDGGEVIDREALEKELERLQTEP